MIAFNEVLIYLAFAVLIVPLAKRFGLGSVLGYLLAGIIIGPILGLVGADTTSIQHVAEFGVVMMLFLIGLELKPAKLWQMRLQILGQGSVQFAVSTILLGIFALLIGYTWNVALALGMIFALSSTAIVLQTLREKGWLKSQAGQSSLAVLLLQDIAVIPILAVLPLLMTKQTHKADAVSNVHPLLASLNGWQHTLVILLIFITLIVASRFVLTPLFKYVARARVLELFTAAILLLIISIALLMNTLGISPALGTFLAGVLLSENEYRHEIKAQVMPFKGLLLAVFFVAIGAGINFNVLLSHMGPIIVWLVSILLIKFIVLATIGLVFRLKKGDFWLFVLCLSQAGEFAFVLLAYAGGIDLIGSEQLNMFYVVVALSMLITPVVFVVFEKIIMPLTSKTDQGFDEQIQETGCAVLVGVGRFGQVVARMLKANKFNTTVIDYDTAMVEQFRKYKAKVYYGNALKVEFLASAGISEAKVFIAATGNRHTQIKLVELVKKYYPDVSVIARAVDRHHVYELEQAGADFVIRELFDASLKAAEAAMVMLGELPEKAAAKAQLFKQHDENTLKELKQDWLEHGMDKHYINRRISKIEELNAIMQAEQDHKPD